VCTQCFLDLPLDWVRPTTFNQPNLQALLLLLATLTVKSDRGAKPWASQKVCMTNPDLLFTNKQP
jgi:hypothetical protein